MPIYEYECLACAWRFQSLVMKEAEEKEASLSKVRKAEKEALDFPCGVPCL